MVVLLYHHSKEDDGGALYVKERQRYAIVLCHPFLPVLARNGDWYKEGDEKVGHPFVSQQGGEIGFKCSQKYPTDENLYNDWNKEKSWTILKAKNVDHGFGYEDNSKHGYCEKRAQGEHWSQGFSGPVVIGQDSPQHSAEGNCHRYGNEDLKVHPKTAKVVLFDQPVKAH